jgi:fatty acid-binding protein DegV
LELLRNGVEGKDTINMMGVVSAAAPETAAELLYEIKKHFKPDEILLANLSPVLGTHTGPGTVAVAYVAGVDHALLKA